MKKYDLKYGTNPAQKPAFISMADNSDLPFEVLNGKPGYINFLDALNSYQLVKELKEALGLAAASSFKHVSPAGCAVGLPLPDRLKKACFLESFKGLDRSPLACAYARARGTDPMSSFGDWAALSDICDETTARLIKKEVSDGVIAPGYTDEALEILKEKKNGNYNIVAIDPDYEPETQENRQVFGINMSQRIDDQKISNDLLKNIVSKNRDLPDSAKRDLIIGMIALKYTQSNSVALACDGQVIGVGAGQQSRIHCTRLAASKAMVWLYRQMEKTMDLPFKKGLARTAKNNVIDQYVNNYEEDVTAEGNWQNYFSTRPEPLSLEEKEAFLKSQDGICLISDAFFPFGDNIQRAHMAGAEYIAEPGGSVRDDDVIEKADKYNMVLAFTGTRLFHH